MCYRNIGNTPFFNVWFRWSCKEIIIFQQCCYCDDQSLQTLCGQFRLPGLDLRNRCKNTSKKLHVPFSDGINHWNRLFLFSPSHCFSEIQWHCWLWSLQLTTIWLKVNSYREGFLYLGKEFTKEKLQIFVKHTIFWSHKIWSSRWRQLFVESKSDAKYEENDLHIYRNSEHPNNYWWFSSDFACLQEPR